MALAESGGPEPARCHYAIRPTRFKPLADEDFGKLEKLGGHRFPIGTRERLNEKLAHICGTVGERLTPREAKGAVELLSELAGNLDRLLGTLCKIRDWQGPGRRLVRLYADFGPVDNALRPEHRRLRELLHELTSRLEGVREGQQSLGPQVKTKAGRHADWRLNYFILVWAIAYEEAGGRATASYDDVTESFKGPFMRLLRHAHTLLPKALQAPRFKALAWRANLVLRKRKKKVK